MGISIYGICFLNIKNRDYIFKSYYDCYFYWKISVLEKTRYNKILRLILFYKCYLFVKLLKWKKLHIYLIICKYSKMASKTKLFFLCHSNKNIEYNKDNGTFL